ncbi:MAG: peptidoglycan bridge formation glycyltransferase FemA/FemB family protein, partial [Sphaerochaetaceae bacterium]|nr:peptidoglycan bridge formation glycyltransferase FemA/FemB family protein [Sphaerochaetaceae bacterium]
SRKSCGDTIVLLLAEEAMDISVEKKSTQGLYTTPLLHQTSFWSRVKQHQGIRSMAFDIKVKAADMYDGPVKDQWFIDDVLMLLLDIGNGKSIGYVPYGPAIHPIEDRYGLFIEELSESLLSYVGNDCIMLRYDLPWESPWAQDEGSHTENGDWTGPPSPSTQEMRLNFSTRNWNIRKAPTDILPTDTSFITVSKKSDVLLSAMKPKTRYNIALAKKKHVRVKTGSAEDIDIFYDLYRQTCMRNTIHLHRKEYFKAMFQTAIGKHTNSGTDFDLLIAQVDGQPLSAMFLTYSSSRATYLFGASASYGRQTMSTYALQWEAIKRANDRGCSEYDLFGTAPNSDSSHPMHGLYRFKTGFGGRPFHRMGCWDYPLDREAYQLFSTSEMVAPGYHR